jgi:hypothetical protein
VLDFNGFCGALLGDASDEKFENNAIVMNK